MDLEQTLFDYLELADTVYTLATDPNDDFASNYYDYPDALSLLVTTMAKLELALKRYNREQIAHIDQLINFSNLSILQLDQFDELGIFVDFQWEEDEEALNGIFADHLPSAMTAGAAMTEGELGIAIDFSPADKPAAKFLEKYIPKLSGEIQDTTKDRVRSTVRQGIINGHSREEMVKDLSGIIDSESRRRMIAQTESVRSFSEGRIQAALEIGATHKIWRAQVVRCPLCNALNGEKVAIRDTFSDGTNLPPRHPRCRCGMRLALK